MNPPRAPSMSTLPFTGNPLRTRGDVQQLVRDLVAPLGWKAFPERLRCEREPDAERGLLDDLAAWLQRINDVRLVQSNWLCFRVLVNLGLRRCGLGWPPEHVTAISPSSIAFIWATARIPTAKRPRIFATDASATATCRWRFTTTACSTRVLPPRTIRRRCARTCADGCASRSSPKPACSRLATPTPSC